MDIKETKELLKGLEKLGIIGVKVFKDGKLGISDLQYLKDLALAFNDFKEAIDGIDKLDDEIKDISIPEAKEILTTVIQIVKNIKAAKQ